MSRVLEAVVSSDYIEVADNVLIKDIGTVLWKELCPIFWLTACLYFLLYLCILLFSTRMALQYPEFNGDIEMVVWGVLLNICAFSYFIEEIFQILAGNQNGYSSKTKQEISTRIISYFYNMWNILDLFGLFGACFMTYFYFGKFSETTVRLTSSITVLLS
eukprot:UN31547